MKYFHQKILQSGPKRSADQHTHSGARTCQGPQAERGPPRPGCLLQFALDSGDVRVRLLSGEDGRTQPAEPKRPTDAYLCALTSTWQAGPGLTETPHLPPQEGLGWPRSEMRAEERRGDVKRPSSSPPWTVLRVGDLGPSATPGQSRSRACGHSEFFMEARLAFDKMTVESEN